MNCEKIEKLLPALAAGELSQRRHKLCRAHLSTCSSCRSQLSDLKRVWEDLPALDCSEPTQEFSDRIAGRVEELITRERAVAAGWRERWRRPEGLNLQRLPARILGGAAAALLLLAAGFLIGSASKQETDGHPGSPEFLLLLHQPLGQVLPPEQLRQAISDYSLWANQLHEQGSLVAGRRLLGDPGMVIQQGDPQPQILPGPLAQQGNRLSGYFILAAADYAEAVRIASDCPHLRYGTIELRRLAGR